MNDRNQKDIDGLRAANTEYGKAHLNALRLQNSRENPVSSKTCRLFILTASNTM
jgi:hypothetical protein